MTNEIYSTRAHTGTSDSRSVKNAFAKGQRRRRKSTKKRAAARQKTKFDLTSNEIPQSRSEAMLKRLLKDYQKPITEGNIVDSVLNANLGKKFLLKKRANQRKFLAIGCAVYHVIAATKRPEEAFERLKQSAKLDQLRTRDPCTIIVNCLVDYGDTKSERLRNRQYAARDARALRYIVRTGMEPQEVEKPKNGESITKWAQKESAYRLKQKPLRVRVQKSAAENFSASESVKQELPVISTSEQHHDILINWVRMGLFVLDPKDGGQALGAIVTPITLSADQAKSHPEKVRAAIVKAVTKVPEKVLKKPSKQFRSASDDDWDQF